MFFFLKDIVDEVSCLVCHLLFSVNLFSFREPQARRIVLVRELVSPKKHICTPDAHQDSDFSVLPVLTNEGGVAIQTLPLARQF